MLEDIITPEDLEEFKNECMTESDYYDRHCEFMIWFNGLEETEKRNFTYVFGENEE